MAQRKEPHDSLDYFPTPPWATRALCEFLGRQHTESMTCWEPACGEGHMAKVLAEYFKDVHASDVHPYGFGRVDDFLLHNPAPPVFDWIITNPPYRLGLDFVVTALSRAKAGVAMLVRLQFLEGQSRYRGLFKKHPPTWILQFTERVTLLKGRLYDRNNGDASATAYCWLIWRLPYFNYGTKFAWIAPCRVQLEREGDYA
jgi:hypothetical protein